MAITTIDSETTTLDPCIMLALAAHFGRSRDLIELHGRILTVVQELGFTDYGFLPMSGGSLEPPLVANPCEQVSSYVQEKYYQDDWVVKYARDNTRPIYMSQVYSVAYDTPYDIDLFRINQKIYQLHQHFGYFDYYLIPMRSCNGCGKVLFGVSMRGATSLEFQLNVSRYHTALQVLCKTIDYVIITKFREELWGEQPIHINRKPLLILSTLANNDTTLAQVAALYGISTITANQHMAAVRRELGVKTTIGAIKKAIEMGLIEYT